MDVLEIPESVDFSQTAEPASGIPLGLEDDPWSDIPESERAEAEAVGLAGPEALDYVAAGRLVRKINRARQDLAMAEAEVDDAIAEAKEEFEAKVRAIELRRESVTRAPRRILDYRLAYYGPLLEEYVRKYTEDKKDRSVAFSGGRVGFRKKTPGVEVTVPEKEVIEWLAKNRPDHARYGCVQTKTVEKLSLKGLRALVESTAEPVHGVVVPPSRDEFYIDEPKED